jgi:uncharacterized protein GlcG (DUF336 family)
MVESPRLPGLTLADADRLVRAALEFAEKQGFSPLAVAVIDLTGELIVLRRGDAGIPVSSRMAVAKARSALRALKPSRELDALPPGIIDGFQHLYGGDFVPRAGGVLVTVDNVILGALGASGASSDQDEEAVIAAVERWQAERTS